MTISRKTVIAAMMVLLTGAVVGEAGETTVGGTLFAHWKMDLTEAAGASEFGLSRAYVTVKSKLSERTSARITADLREADGFDGYSIVLKYGYLDWKPGFGKGVYRFRFGLQPTLYIDEMNKLWGRRYLMKTVGDLRGFLTTSDLGVGAMLDLGEKGRAGHVALNIWNGTSYTDIEERNRRKDLSVFARFAPLRGRPDLERSAIQGQVYVGALNVAPGEGEEISDYDHSLFSIGGLLAYRRTLDIGVDVNFYREGQGPGADDLKQTGHSFFLTLYLSDLVAADSPLRTLNFFGRVDMYDPDAYADDDGETTVVAGVECVPVSGFKASLNWRSTSFQADDRDSAKFMYLNTLVAF
ncbi:MAG: hypothetical protein JSW34_09695 [Candidatus Zixiibacteriota bacterium]|nr:MAG: hypothetical protein JSW34_09695 [candidate division Zixibacteria bacterium]